LRPKTKTKTIKQDHIDAPDRSSVYVVVLVLGFISPHAGYRTTDVNAIL
jgi:hypothetical protein